ncbi:tryptophan synthase subunit alpha [Photobacterium carnosum]|uniref:tryptophan synthase subunit alpha n=1 Tax=Photobacterium carnosum TaxID=2023717 RepID=UPI001E389415|nr:tryptophan synthase subunit alpha [Photobacterium carnosum]MCD9521287.1 tryptophan synthase subunit alpha [Photobacterium carnosum]MCD9556549.1 tryptophan synthase subunit alpha [Photobacterium carnosum]
MDRYHNLFTQLSTRNEGAFVPFVTLGDPTPQRSMDIIDTLVAAGADALELGIPFSDPLADGPTIQGANIRALAAKTTPIVCFEMLTQIRAKYPQLPIGLLMYANLVFATGIDNFYRRCADAGVDSVLIADVPVNVSLEFRVAAEAQGIHPIFIAPPNADAATLKTVSELSGGYTYLLSRAGVTGAETKAEMPIEPLLAALKAHNAPPALLGFGISTPEQVKAAVSAGAAGVISGSAVVNIIEHNRNDHPVMLQKLSDFICTMKSATLR